jgi:3-oxoacyl-(acyl-carrier-protein) synthase
LTGEPVYIASAGIVSPLGRGLTATEQALRENGSAIAPLRVFPLLQGPPLPVGQISDMNARSSLPRTHQLAREAALMAMQDCTEPIDAILLGCTTGGILTTEELLREHAADKEAYRRHGLLTVAEDIAELCNCSGPALMISTACSSSVVAIALAMSLLRTGKMRRILAGGVDSLSRLTYFGFHSLQLVDRKGCRPLDVSRQGTTVAEGAAVLSLTAARPKNPLAVLLGAGLSCDAYHPAAPHPEGKGAFTAMQAALTDAGIQPSAIDYINLHGTGTHDNDLSEAKAIHALFPTPPPLSSIKGATGHGLGAAGAIEAVVSSLTVSRGFIPGNTGCRHPDPALELTPQATPVDRPVRTVLSNSFGLEEITAPWSSDERIHLPLPQLFPPPDDQKSRWPFTAAPV